MLWIPNYAFFIRTRGAHFCSKFRQIKNNPGLGRRTKSQIFQLVVNKTAASAAQFVKCILLHAY